MTRPEEMVADCLAGRLSPEMALARLVLAGGNADSVGALLAPLGPEAEALRRAYARHRDGLDLLARMLGEIGAVHVPGGSAPEAEVARIAALFDRAAALSPEAGVAAYSLGDADTLAAATAEIVAWLEASGLLGGDVLDLGCGFGRVAAALAGRTRSVLGLDVSPAMVAEARRRHGTQPGVRFERTDGTGLGALADASFDLMLAVDSFPYLVQAGGGLAERHVADAARVLRPGGALAILNLSYREDLTADRADIARWAAAHGFRVKADGERPFRLWNGTAFLLRRA